jgi:predicted transcriptional regulator
LQLLVADLVAARAVVDMTQRGVADRMPGTRSVVSRLESGVHTPYADGE